MGRPEVGRLAGVVLVLAVVVVAGVAGVARRAAADPLITCPDTPVIHQVCSVGTAGPNLAADGIQAVAGTVFDQATKWVVSGAESVVGFIGKTIDGGTEPDTSASWFEPNYRLMVSVGVAFLAPLLMAAAASSLLRRDVGGVIRLITITLPVAAVGMVLATWLVNMLVAVTDNLSAFVGSTIGGSGEKFATGVVHLMEASFVTGNGPFTGFLAFLVALVIALFALLLWIELVVRQAAVLAATLFLPLGFAGMVWQSTSHWLRKLAEGLLALILAKFVITAIVAVGANAITAGGDNPAAVILGAGILAVAVFSPYVLLSIIPLGTLAVTEGLSRRPLHAGSSTMSSLYWGQALLGGGGAGGGAAAVVGATPSAAAAAAGGAGAPAGAVPGGVPAAGGAAAPVASAAGGVPVAGAAAAAGRAAGAAGQAAHALVDTVPDGVAAAPPGPSTSSAGDGHGG